MTRRGDARSHAWVAPSCLRDTGRISNEFCSLRRGQTLREMVVKRQIPRQLTDDVQLMREPWSKDSDVGGSPRVCIFKREKGAERGKVGPIGETLNYQKRK